MLRRKEATQKELVAQVLHKFRNATPMVKKVAFSGINSWSKKKLLAYLKKWRVTTHGDLSTFPPIKRK
jgi:hypothetical protein